MHYKAGSKGAGYSKETFVLVKCRKSLYTVIVLAIKRFHKSHARVYT